MKKRHLKKYKDSNQLQPFDLSSAQNIVSEGLSEDFKSLNLEEPSDQDHLKSKLEDREFAIDGRGESHPGSFSHESKEVESQAANSQFRPIEPFRSKTSSESAPDHSENSKTPVLKGSSGKTFKRKNTKSLSAVIRLLSGGEKTSKKQVSETFQSDSAESTGVKSMNLKPKVFDPVECNNTTTEDTYPTPPIEQSDINWFSKVTGLESLTENSLKNENSRSVEGVQASLFIDKPEVSVYCSSTHNRCEPDDSVLGCSNEGKPTVSENRTVEPNSDELPMPTLSPPGSVSMQATDYPPNILVGMTSIEKGSITSDKVYQVESSEPTREYQKTANLEKAAIKDGLLEDHRPEIAAGSNFESDETVSRPKRLASKGLKKVLKSKNAKPRGVISESNDSDLENFSPIVPPKKHSKISKSSPRAFVSTSTNTSTRPVRILKKRDKLCKMSDAKEEIGSESGNLSSKNIPPEAERKTRRRVRFEFPEDSTNGSSIVEKQKLKKSSVEPEGEVSIRTTQAVKKTSIISCELKDLEEEKASLKSKVLSKRGRKRTKHPARETKKMGDEIVKENCFNPFVLIEPLEEKYRSKLLRDSNVRQRLGIRSRKLSPEVLEASKDAQSRTPESTLSSNLSHSKFCRESLDNPENENRETENIPSKTLTELSKGSRPVNHQKASAREGSTFEESKSIVLTEEELTKTLNILKPGKEKYIIETAKSPSKPKITHSKGRRRTRSVTNAHVSTDEEPEVKNLNIRLSSSKMKQKKPSKHLMNGDSKYGHSETSNLSKKSKRIKAKKELESDKSVMRATEEFSSQLENTQSVKLTNFTRVPKKRGRPKKQTVTLAVEITNSDSKCSESVKSKKNKKKKDVLLPKDHMENGSKGLEQSVERKSRRKKRKSKNLKEPSVESKAKDKKRKESNKQTRERSKTQIGQVPENQESEFVTTTIGNPSLPKLLDSKREIQSGIPVPPTSDGVGAFPDESKNHSSTSVDIEPSECQLDKTQGPQGLETLQASELVSENKVSTDEEMDSSPGHDSDLDETVIYSDASGSPGKSAENGKTRRSSFYSLRTTGQFLEQRQSSSECAKWQLKICNACNKCYLREDDMVSHFATAHATRGGKNKSPKGLSIYRRRSVKFASQFPIEEGRIHCSVCDRGFSLSAFKDHTYSCIGQLFFRCNFCHWVFYGKEELSNHLYWDHDENDVELK